MHLRRLPPTLRLKLYEIVEDLIKDINQYNATQGYVEYSWIVEAEQNKLL